MTCLMLTHWLPHVVSPMLNPLRTTAFVTRWFSLCYRHLLDKMDEPMEEDEQAEYTDGEGLEDDPSESGYVTNYCETDADADSDYFSGDGLDDLQYCDEAYATEVTGKVCLRCLQAV
jgi:hypothetical protein